MEIMYLEVLVMDNGEIINEGKTLGWKDKMGKYLVKADRIKPEPTAEPQEPPLL